MRTPSQPLSHFPVAPTISPLRPPRAYMTALPILSKKTMPFLALVTLPTSTRTCVTWRPAPLARVDCSWTASWTLEMAALYTSTCRGEVVGSELSQFDESDDLCRSDPQHHRERELDNSA